MAADTKDQALDLVAAIFVRAGARLPAAESLRRLTHPEDNCPEGIERAAA